MEITITIKGIGDDDVLTPEQETAIQSVINSSLIDLSHGVVELDRFDVDAKFYRVN